ncbi:MAG: SMP-30/gluconolactonase/LRE family protein [Propionibacteriaceae bacterium]
MTDEHEQVVASDLIAPDAVIERVATGCIWSEGPVWLPERQVLRWSDIPNDQIMDYDAERDHASVYRSGVEFTNGRTLDLDGSVLQCSHGRRRVERDRDGVVTNVVDHFRGHRLNSPNDVVVHSDGSIWFTDPPYGILLEVEGHPGVREYGDCYVFCYEPRTDELRAVVIDVEHPNGLAFSPDESILYVADTSGSLPAHLGGHPGEGSGNHHLRAYDVDRGRAKNGRTLAVVEGGRADGFRVDEQGRIWTSVDHSIAVYSPAGQRLLLLEVPELTSNVCFGGADGHDLYITASTSLYRIRTTTRQAPRPT